MKKLGLLGKFIFFLNSVAAVLLLIGYILPFISPRVFPALAVLTLVLPVLIIVNLLFCVYWLLRFRRQFLLSAIVLGIGVTYISSLYRFSSKETSDEQEGLSVLSYNVRTFNQWSWKDEKDVASKIIAFVEAQQPDIVCFQEYHPAGELHEKQYPYIYKRMRNRSQTFGQAIFSKYPIVSTGSLDFEGTGNNVIYADIVKQNDTVRVYNVHFQSLSISPKFSHLQEEDSKRLLGRMGAIFVKQEAQAAQFLAHEQTSKYPVIVAGDFNNSAGSYLYRKVKGEKEDAFAKAGSGTGRTYNFDFVPMRIDFILIDPAYEVSQFETYDVTLSDHFPILARFQKLSSTASR